MYCCLLGMFVSGKFSNSYCQRFVNYIISCVKYWCLKICFNFRLKFMKEKLEENYLIELIDFNLIDGFKVISM